MTMLLITVMVCLSLIVIAYLVTIYNNLVRLKNAVKENWANIDVLLKQRNSEIPKLIASCKKYMQYEEGTLEKITQCRTAVESARQQTDPRRLGEAEAGLRQSLRGLFAVAENYPDLKTNDSFQQLQSRISQLETFISDRRELYNDSVKINNTRIEQFPAVLFAKKFGFIHAHLLVFSAKEIADVDVKEVFDND